MIVRGIFCAVEQKTFKKKIHAISIVDEYLEHSRVMYFYNKGSEDVYLSSADWMTRNLDYRIEAAVKYASSIDLTKLQNGGTVYIEYKANRNEVRDALNSGKKVPTYIKVYLKQGRNGLS